MSRQTSGQSAEEGCCIELPVLFHPLVPAKAGTQRWIPAYAGMSGTVLPQIQRLEEVVAFVVDHDEGGEIHHLDAPDRFHAELGIFDTLDLLDAMLGEVGGGAA